MSEETPNPPQTPTLVVTPRAFIDDGYTIPFSIPEIRGTSQALSGVYRPMTPRQKTELFTALEKPGAEVAKKDKLASEALVKHLVSWDLTTDGTPDGAAVPLTVDNVGRIYPTSLWNRMFEIVTGTANVDTTEALVIDAVRDSTLDVDAKIVSIRKTLEARETATIEGALKN